MKTLVLLRHAKSDWPEDTPDFERPLTEKGRLHAEAAAAFLAEHFPDIQLIISSPAQRTIETASFVSKKMHVEISTNESLYNAPEENFFKVLSEIEDTFTHILLVGHNNGISNFANSLSEEIIHFPTAGIAAFRLNISSWKEITEGCGKLLTFTEPEDYYKKP